MLLILLTLLFCNVKAVHQLGIFFLSNCSKVSSNTTDILLLLNLILFYLEKLLLVYIFFSFIF